MFRRPLPKRATLAALLGAIYAVLILPAPGTLLGVHVVGIAWFLLAVGLLFLVPLAYHAYATWALVFVVWRLLGYWRDGAAAPWVPVVDLALPTASVVMLMTSSYLKDAKAWREKEERDEATAQSRT